MNEIPIGYRIPVDFRDRVRAISLAELERLGIPPERADLTKANRSLCVPAAGDIADTRRLLAWLFGGQFIGVFAIAALGVLLTYVSAHWATAAPRICELLLYPSLTLMSIGALALCCSVDIQNRLVRSVLRSVQAPVPQFQLSERPLVVHIEDPLTCQKIKLVVEDLGLLYCDSARRLVVIEGLFFRYVIRGRDLVQCEPYKTAVARHILITYRIAESPQTLSLVVSFNTALLELLRQLSLNRSRVPLTAMFQRTFGIDVMPS